MNVNNILQRISDIQKELTELQLEILKANEHDFIDNELNKPNKNPYPYPDISPCPYPIPWPGIYPPYDNPWSVGNNNIKTTTDININDLDINQTNKTKWDL